MVVAIIAMAVVMVMLDGHKIHLPEAHALLCHDLFSQLSYALRVAAEQSHFHAMAMVKPCAH